MTDAVMFMHNAIIERIIFLAFYGVLFIEMTRCRGEVKSGIGCVCACRNYGVRGEFLKFDVHCFLFFE
jgi:hypothetical protein